MLEQAVLISTYVQHYHKDLAKDSYYLTKKPRGDVKFKLETVKKLTASSSGKQQRGFTQPIFAQRLQIVWIKCIYVK